MQVFSEKYCPNVSEAQRFFRKPAGLDLAGQWDTELPLHNEGKGLLYFSEYMRFKKKNEDVTI